MRRHVMSEPQVNCPLIRRGAQGTQKGRLCPGVPQAQLRRAAGSGECRVQSKAPRAGQATVRAPVASGLLLWFPA